MLMIIVNGTPIQDLFNPPTIINSLEFQLLGNQIVPASEVPTIKSAIWKLVENLTNEVFLFNGEIIYKHEVIKNRH